jgi:hypothetical protein
MKTVLQVAIPQLRSPLDPQRFQRATDDLTKALRGLSGVHTVVFTAASQTDSEAQKAQWLLMRQLARELRSHGASRLLATPSLMTLDRELGMKAPVLSAEWAVAGDLRVHCEAYATFVSLAGVPDARAYTDLLERVQRQTAHSVVSGAPKLWLFEGDAWADRQRIQELRSQLAAEHSEDYAPDVVLCSSGTPGQPGGPLCMVAKPGHPIWFLDADPDEPRLHHLEFPSDRDRRADSQFFRLRIQHKNERLPRAVRLEMGEDLGQRDLWWSPLYMEVHDTLERWVERVAAKDLSIVTYAVGSYWPDVIPLWCRMVGDPTQHCRKGRLEAIHDPDGRQVVVRRLPSALLFPELNQDGGTPAGRREPLSARLRPFVEFIADNLALPPHGRVRIVLVVHDFDELIDNQERGGQPEHVPSGTSPEEDRHASVWQELVSWKGYRRGDQVATSLALWFRHDRHQAIRDNLLRVAALQSAANLLGDPLEELPPINAERVLDLLSAYRRLVPVSGTGDTWAVRGEFLHPVMDHLLAETSAEFVRLVDHSDRRDSGRPPATHSRLGTAASGALSWLSRELDVVCEKEGAFFREGYALHKYFEEGPKARTLPLATVRPVLQKIADRIRSHEVLSNPFDNPVMLSAEPGEGEVLSALVELGYLDRQADGFLVRKPLVFLGWSQWNARGDATMFQAEAL